MAKWIERFKKAVGRKEAEAAAERLAVFRALIVQDDPNAIEAARDGVQSRDIEPLIALYWELDSWPQKRALVDLLQDQYHDDMPAMMLDFLRVPVGEGEEWIELSQAVALGFIDEKYDRFMTYYNDRNLLARDVQTVLRQNGLKAEVAPEPAREEEAPPPASRVDPAKHPNQRLMDAAVYGEMTAVQQALADGAKINVTIGSGNKIGCTPLIMALMNKHFDIALFLIDEGADVRKRRSDEHRPNPDRGQTALWWAANHGQMGLVKRLLAEGAEINMPDQHGSTPLHQAASSGHLDITRYLVEQGADIEAGIYDGRRPFNLAVTNGHKKVAEFLLAQGNDPNAVTGGGWTPLMVAAENNFYDLARSLISRGADINATHAGEWLYANLRGWTPLIFAVNAGYVRMTKLLIQAGADVHYIVPATTGYDGQPLPARAVADFVKGKRAESIMKLLGEAK